MPDKFSAVHLKFGARKNRRLTNFGISCHWVPESAAAIWDLRNVVVAVIVQNTCALDVSFFSSPFFRVPRIGGLFWGLSTQRKAKGAGTFLLAGFLSKERKTIWNLRFGKTN